MTEKNFTNKKTRAEKRQYTFREGLKPVLMNRDGTKSTGSRLEQQDSITETPIQRDTKARNKGKI